LELLLEELRPGSQLRDRQNSQHKIEVKEIEKRINLIVILRLLL
jgi:hypothetical protein